MSGVSEMISVKQQSNACSNVEDKPELQLLDLYCGCGAMSTGLCLGANLAGANLVTRWAVDLNEYACISMKHNHPETKVNPHSRTLSSQCFYIVLLDLFGTA
jgi:DNA (cytosine-5)-methyltransferase 1